MPEVFTLSQAARDVDAAVRERKGLDGPLEERRKEELEALSLLPVADGVEIRPADVVGDSILAVPENKAADGPVLLYLHGGAYETGSGRSRASVASHLARATGSLVLSLDYRLAPENPFPAAVDDAIAGLDACQGMSGGGGTVVLGDSAGGGLATATMLRARDSGSALPLCGVLYSPWVDLTLAEPSVREKAKADSMLVQDRLERAAKGYAGSTPRSDPLVSPRFAEFQGLPPLQVFVSSTELLLDEGIALAASAARAGVRVDLHVWPGMFHAWPVATGIVPESDEVVELTARFVARFTGC